MYSVAAHQSYDRSERRPHPRQPHPAQVQQQQQQQQQQQLNQVGDSHGVPGSSEAAAGTKHKRRSKHRLSITTRLFNYIKQQFQKEEVEEEFEDFQIFVARHRPEELAKLARTTKFTRKEIQVIYRGFKQECPTGTVDEDSFKKIFSAFFPQGDARQYAHYVFNTINKENVTGKISFEDFLGILSKVSRGSIQEKLQWIFGLYDLNGDGNITKSEMLDVVTSIYEMLGRSTNPAVGEHTAKEHVEKIFCQIDTNKDGVVTIDELVEWCSRDAQILQSLDTLDTVL